MYWFLFILLIVSLIFLDLFVFKRKQHVMKGLEASLWSAFWIGLALAFTGVIYYIYELEPGGLTGREAALQFFTGYLIEKFLSMDNIFVIAMIFAAYQIPLQYQNRVLTWGILGAIVMRGAMILGGITLIAKFSWVIYVFGLILLYTAIRFAFFKKKETVPSNVKFVQRYFPLHPELDGNHFFVRRSGKWLATPLLLALVQIELADVFFAIDSIPAIFAVTKDPFIIFTSNIFAILGLRALYFTLFTLLSNFEYLEYSLASILAFVAIKILISPFYQIPIWISLTTISLLFCIGIGLSLVLKPKR